MMSVIRALFYLFFPFVHQLLNALLYFFGFKFGADEHTPAPTMTYLLSVTTGTAILFVTLYAVMSLTTNAAAFSALFPAIFEPSQGIVLHNIFKGTFWMVLVTCLAHVIIITTGTLVGIKRTALVVLLANACSYLITFAVLRYIA